MLSEAIVPEWDAGERVGALMTTRAGGVSAPPRDSLNLGFGSGDAPAAVQANRRRVAGAIGVVPVYLKQVHGTRVVRLEAARAGVGSGAPREACLGAPPERPPGRPPEPTLDPLPDPLPEAADASFTTEPGVACAVMVADCMPVLLAAPHGRAVAAAHAGWRGLAGGVVDHAVRAVCEAASCAPGDLSAWLGPCIGPAAFEVGADVLEAFGVAAAPAGSGRFAWRPRPDGQPRWLADLPALGRDRLAALGVRHVAGGRWCTVQDRSRFFSFRRDGVTGRMAAAIWRMA